MLVKLKDICNITMGQSPDSSYYNTSGDGLPFYKEGQLLEEFIHTTKHGQLLIISVQIPMIY